MSGEKQATPEQVEKVNEFVDKVIPWKNPIMRYFQYGHLPEGKMRNVSAMCQQLAQAMNEMCPDGIQKTAGMQDLLRAKDCFVRSVLP